MADKASVATAYVTVIPEISGAQSNITNDLSNTMGAAGEKAGTSLGTSLLTKLKGYSKQITTAVGLASLTKVASDCVSSFTNLASETKSLQRTMGGSAEDVSSLSGAMKMSGVDTSKATTSLNKFAKSMSSAASGSSTYVNAFEQIGVSVTDASGNLRSTSDVIADVSDAFAGMDDGAEKTALAMTLFGKSGTTLLPFLNKGSAGIEELKDKANELGIVIDDTDMSKWSAYKSAIREWSTALEGAKVQIGSAITPFITFGTQCLDSVLVPAISGAARAFSDFIDGFSTNIDFEGITTALGGLGDAFLGAFGTDGSGTVADFGTAVANMINSVVPLLEGANPLFSALGSAIAFIADRPEVVSIIGGIALAFAGFSILSSISSSLSGVVGGISSIINKAAATVGALLGIGGAETVAGTASATSAGQILAAAAAVISLGAGVLLASTGLSMLATSAVEVASAGPAAAAVLAGMIGTIAAFAAGAAVLGPALTAGAVGLVAFGVAALGAGAGIALAGVGIQLVASVLPTICEYGGTAAAAMAQIAGASVTMAAGVTALGAGCTAGAVGIAAITVALAAADVAIAAAAGAMGLLSVAVNAVADGVSKMGEGFEKMGQGTEKLADKGSSAAWSLGELGAAAWSTNGNIEAVGKTVESVSSKVLAAVPSFTAMGASAVVAATTAQAAITTACRQMQLTINSLDLKVRVSVDKLPHFTMSGKFDAETGEVPTIGVNWYAKGGVFDKNALIGVGDNKRYSEAVLPLSPAVLGDIGQGIEDEMTVSDGVTIIMNGATLNSDTRMEEVAYNFLSEVLRMNKLNKAGA